MSPRADLWFGDSSTADLLKWPRL